MTTQAYEERKKTETEAERRERLEKLAAESKASGLIHIGSLEKFAAWLRDARS